MWGPTKFHCKKWVYLPNVPSRIPRVEIKTCHHLDDPIHGTTWVSYDSERDLNNCSQQHNAPLSTVHRPYLNEIFFALQVLTHQVQELVHMCTGNTLIMDFATFFVGSGIDASGATTRETSGRRGRMSGGPATGWPPHRDRSSDASTTAFRSDGLPQYSTTWIPLTTASTTNSCLYVVPRMYDAGYHLGDHGKNPLEVIFKDPAAFQYIRALPCAAGSLVHFSHRLLHWGSAAGTCDSLWGFCGAPCTCLTD